MAAWFTTCHRYCRTCGRVAYLGLMSVVVNQAALVGVGVCWAERSRSCRKYARLLAR